MASFLADHLSTTGAEPDLAAVVLVIAEAAPVLSRRLAAGSLAGDPGRVVGRNETGGAHAALNLWEHDLMLRALRGAPVRAVLSGEAETVILLNFAAPHDVAMDPLDGPGSLGLGAPLGTLFSVLPAAPEGFLRPRRAVIAAGYISYGHSTDVGISLGRGVALATLDPEVGAFRVNDPDLRRPATTSSVARNASNERHWKAGLRAHVTDPRAGAEGPRGKDFNMRWLAAAVGELHRILKRGACPCIPPTRGRATALDGYGSPTRPSPSPS